MRQLTLSMRQTSAEARSFKQRTTMPKVIFFTFIYKLHIMYVLAILYTTFKNENNKKPLFLMPAIILLLDQHTYVQKYIVNWYSTWLSDFDLFC